MPNWIISRIDGASFDLTATFARIEDQYGSKTECSAAEAKERRIHKELLKLACVAFALDPDSNPELSGLAKTWLMPEYPSFVERYYKQFTLK